jgi:hypothetical protein
MQGTPVNNAPVKIKQLGYILLLPVFFLLHSYNELFGFIPPGYLFTFGLGLYLFTGIVFLIAFLITRSVTVTAFITFCILLFTLFFGAWHDFFKSIMPNAIFSRYLVVLPVTVLGIIGIAWYFIKKRRLIPAVSTYLSLVVLILCGLDIINLVIHYRQYRKDNNLLYHNRPICNNYVSCKQSDTLKPDIYYIVFDEYTDNRTLQQLWQFDNSNITNWLLQKGFYIPDSSKANYSFTAYSISSILNMNYPAIKQGNIDEVPYQYLKAVKSMSDNETFCALQKEHYQFHFLGPFNNSFETLDVDREFNDFVEKKLYDHTFPARFKEDLGWHFKIHADNITESAKSVERSYVKKDHDNNIIISKIKATVNPATNRQPQFVYGHLMLTHKPHIYDPAGKVRTAADVMSKKSLFDTYINQVKQANTVIQELVTHILTHNKRNTLIIVMGDHGFRHLPAEQRSYYFPIFSAFYFPGKTPDPALRNISAVNTFRIVFNQYFCQNLPLLKDSSILVKY